MKRRNIIAFVFTLGLIGLMGYSPGCAAADAQKVENALQASRAQIDQQTQEAVKASNDITAKIEAANAAGQADAVKALSEQKAKADANAASLSKQLETVNKALATLDAARSADGSIDPSGAVAAAAPFLPPPWNGFAILGGVLATAALQEIRVRRGVNAAVSLVNAREAVKAADPAAAAAYAKHAGLVLQEQTPLATKIATENALAKPTAS